jgi:Fe-S-cluster-containing hydrogenase component 2
MRESTKVLLKKHGWRIDRAIHNYIYFRWYYPYVKTVSVFIGPLKYLTWFKPLKYVGSIAFNRYHAKFISSGDARKIFTLNEDVRLVSDENKRIVPFKYAHKIIFQNPEYVAVMDCPCKKAFKAPADTINSCIVVGSGTGKFWVDTCAKYNARQITQSEAMDMVSHYRSKGYVTQAFFKVATGGSTGVICNCHPDTCVSLKASSITRKIDRSVTMNVKSGYSVRRDPAKCKKCGACVAACHFSAMEMTADGPLYNREECMGCELCVEACVNGALSLYVDPEKPMPLDMDLVKTEIKKQAGK